ncbi:hypothetical protein SAMN06265222_11884 [Neorhodopirellula lusitana]|uniref:Thioredoxin domain-containing protein n=2 Tax=Neorhodopirellula lusitana TaxID=445327 RepID=A0ABY1QMF7_9BACT|nr:hypothetical protein SAMN06265222_11884 [Neorhodopirellula lusitana]
MPDDVRYETVDIARVNAKGHNIRMTPTLMVFVGGKLEHTSSGLLRGDRLQAFLDRSGVGESDDADLSDNLSPWSNPRRSYRDFERGPIRDRFAWWLLGKWLGFDGAGLMMILPWLLKARRSSQNRTHKEKSRWKVSNRQTVRRKRPKMKQ